MDEEKRLCGLNYARQLNFTEAQYEEALKRIDSPDNANQLLAALIDVCNHGYESAVISGKSSNKTSAITAGADTTNQVQTNAGRPNAVSSVVGHQNLVPSLATSPEAVQTTSMTTTNYFEHGETSDSVSSLSTTSCYSSITSFPSSSDQSLESLTNSSNSNQQQSSLLASNQSVATPLRRIYIDGSNVARTHGKNRIFSWNGIKLCVDWFLNRRHEVVKVLVPEDKCQRIEDEIFINYLEKVDALIRTPSGCNDDFFIIEAARQNNGIIVSNDLYRDEKRSNNELEKFINDNRLPYIFVEDLFIPAEGPRGRFGPTLNAFLREQPAIQSLSHNKLARTKSHQRYQRNGHSSRQPNLPFASPNQILNVHTGDQSHRALQSTKSLPLEQSSYGYINQPADNLRFPSELTCTIKNDNSYPNRAIQQQTVISQVDNDQQLEKSSRIIRKSKSIAFGNNTINHAKEFQSQREEQAQFGRKSALMRTKSHNM